MSLQLLLEREDIPEDVKRDINQTIIEQKKTENELIKTKKRLEYLLRSEPAIIYSCEPWGDYQTTYMSKNVEEVLGHNAQEFLYKHSFWVDRLHPKDKRRVISSFPDIANLDFYSDEYRFQHKDGTYRWMLEEANLIRDEQGNPLEVVGHWTDITKRKQTEISLRERVKELMCLYKISRLITEPSRSEGEVCLKTIELIPPAWQYPEITCARVLFKGDTYSTENFLETPWKQSADIMVSGKKSGSIEVYYLEERPDSDEGPFQKEERELINVIAVEIGKYAEHKQIEVQLRNERENLYNILNSTDDCIYIVNSHYEIEFINAALEREFGPVDGKKCYEYFNGFNEACSWCTMEKVLNGETIRWERTLPRNQKTYDIIDAPFRNLEGNISILSIFRDITERKQIEEALKESEEKWRSLVENSSDFIVLVDRDGIIQYINRILPELTMEEVIGKSMYDFQPPESQKIHSEFFERVFQTGEPESFEATGLGPGDTISWYETQFVPIKRKNFVESVIIVTKDITERKKAEQALQESEEKYRNLIEQSTDGITLANVDGTVIEWNKSMEKISGLKKEDILGKLAWDVNFMMTREEFRISEHYNRDKTIFMDLLKKGETNTNLHMVEAEIITPEGIQRGIQYQIFPIRTSDGFMIGSIIRDTTEQKNKERALEESEKKFRDLAEKSPNMIFINKMGRIVFANEECVKIMGYSKDEIYSPDFDFLHLIKPEYKEKITSNFKKHLRGEEVEPLEYTLITKDGKRIEAILTTKLIDYEKEKAILGIIIDITAIKAAEIRLQESEERLRVFMDSATDGFILFDSNLNFVDINSAAAEGLGITKEEIIGKNILEIKPNLLETGRYDEYLEVIRTGKPFSIDSVPSAHDIGKRYYSVRAFKVSEGLGVISTDITSRVKAEKTREELEQRRDNFIWMTSHELRTPLTVLTGYCDFLIDHMNNLTQKRITNILSVMKSNLDRLERLTKKVSTIGQIEQGIFEIEKTSMDLCEFLQNTIEPYQHLLGEQFEFQMRQEYPSLIINGDPNRLQQVLDNIIGNAIKQTDKDCRKIMVTKKISPTKIKIEVSDNGAGIASENLETIFEQFVSIPTEYSASGTGIGLYLCQKILKAHGGMITAQSIGPGHGATFTIELPRINAMDSRDF